MSEWDWNRKAREASHGQEDDKWYSLSDETKYYIKVTATGVGLSGLVLGGAGYGAMEYTDSLEVSDVLPLMVENSEEISEAAQYTMEVCNALG